MKKYIVSVASCLFALCMQSCFQDMDHPAFDYPESTGEVPTTPLLRCIFLLMKRTFGIKVNGDFW